MSGKEGKHELSAIIHHHSKMELRRVTRNKCQIGLTARALRKIGAISLVDRLQDAVAIADRRQIDAAAHSGTTLAYRKGSRLLATHGKKPLPRLKRDVGDILTQEVVKRVARAAPFLVEAYGPDKRLLFITVTIGATDDNGTHLDWRQRFGLGVERRDSLMKSLAPFVSWQAKSFEVQAPKGGYGPHWHLLVLIHADDLTAVSQILQAQPGQKTLAVRCCDTHDGLLTSELKTDLSRRRSYLRTLVYTTKPPVEGLYDKLSRLRTKDEHGHLVFSGVWHRALASVVKEKSLAQHSPNATLAARALLNEMGAGMMFSCSRTITPRRSRRVAAATTTKMVSPIGRPKVAISPEWIHNVMDLFVSAKKTAAALRIDEKTLRRLCDRHGIPRTLRG